MSPSGAPEGDIDVERIDASPEFQYGGATFVAASEHFRIHHCSGASAWIRLPRAVADGAGCRALIREFRGLPRVPVYLSGTDDGRAIHEYLNKWRYRYRNNRRAQGVLILPPTFAEYLRGRSRQALRTNIRAAKAEGITCAAIERTELESVLDEWLRKEPGVTEMRCAQKDMALKVADHSRWYVAFDAAGRPVAVANLYIDHRWSLLNAMSSVSYPARWLLHTHLVEELYAAGSRNLLVADAHALKMEPNLQYYQQRLGYRVVNLSPVKLSTAT